MTDPTAPAEQPAAVSYDPAAQVETSDNARPVDPAPAGNDQAEPHPSAGEYIDPNVPTDDAYHGPYDAAANGTDAHGQPLNAFGRSEAMNTPEAVTQELGEVAQDD